MADLLEKFVDPSMARFMLRATRKELPVPMPFPLLSKRVGNGFFPGLYVLAGTTGTGKTQWLLDLLLNAVDAGHAGTYVGLEMGPMDLMARILGMYSGRAWSDYFLGTIGPELLEQDIRKYGDRLKSLPLRVQFSPPGGWHIKNLLEEAKDLKGRSVAGKTSLLAVDYLQLVAPTERGETRRETIAQAANLGRVVASNFDCAVVMVSSTAREHYEKMMNAKKDIMDQDPRLFAGVGKESGDIEYACDGQFVMLSGKGQNVYMAISKFRARPPGWEQFTFTGTRLIQEAKMRGITSEEELRLAIAPGMAFTNDAFLTLTKGMGPDAKVMRDKLIADGTLLETEEGRLKVI